MTRSSPRFNLTWLPIAVACVIVSACGLGMTAEDRVERAAAAMDEGDYQSASLDLKRALQDQPNNADARRMLGHTFLRLGDPESAEAELLRAGTLGVTDSVINADLANAYWQQGKLDELLNEPLLVDGLSDDDRAAIRLYRGRAHLVTGSPDVARRDFDITLSLQPDNVQALLGVVSSFSEEGNFAEARRRMGELVAKRPDNAAVRVASGGLYASGDAPDFNRAEREYAAALEAAKTSGDMLQQQEALAGLARAYLEQRDIDGAASAVQEYREIAPDDVFGKVLDGQVRLTRDQVAEAIDVLQIALRQSPNHPGANMLMGMAQAREGKLGQAEVYLATAVQADPANSAARTMLARIRGDLRKSESAVAVLEPLIELDDVNALGVAADLKLAAGDTAAGLELLRRRLEVDPDNAAMRVDYAGALMSVGQTDAAREVLALLDTDADSTQATRAAVVGVLAKLADGDRGGAILDAERASAERPDDVTLLQLLGRLYLEDGRIDTAAGVFADTIDRFPQDLAAYDSLAQIRLDEGDSAGALKLYEQAVQQADQKAPALFMYAELAALQGETTAAEQSLREALSLQPDFTPARLMLGRVLAAAGDATAAREQLLEAVESDGDNAEAHFYLGVLELAQGRADSALGALEKSVALAPANPGAVFNLARAHKALDQLDAQRNVLEQGVDAGVTHPAVVASLANLLAQDNQIDRALALADTISAPRERDAVIDLVKGDLYSEVGDFAAASRKYRAAFSASADWRLAAKQMIAAHRAGERNPSNLLENYVETNPTNTDARAALAQLQLEQGAVDDAVSGYEAILDRQPDNVQAMNNLAWVLAEAGDPRAVGLAEKAAGLSPDNGAVADTLGWALVKTGDPARGLEALRRAATLDPENLDISFHIATALVDLGDNAEARSVLETLLGNDRAFPARADAQALLEGLAP